MPLTAIKCCQTGNPEPFQRCINASLVGRPAACRWSFPHIAFMAESEQSRSGVGNSVTNLTGCARQVILKRQYAYSAPPEDYWNMFRGSVGHEMVSKYHSYVPSGLAEVRLRKTYTVDGTPVELSGQPDWQVDDYGVDPAGMVADFKSTMRTISDGMEVKEEHYRQVGYGYAGLFRGGVRDDTGETVNKDIRLGQIIYFNMETSRTISFDVPRSGQDEWIVDRLKPFLHHERTGQLPDILPNRIVRSKRGTTQVERHPLCNPDYCPVRAICDQLSAEGK